MPPVHAAVAALARWRKRSLLDLHPNSAENRYRAERFRLFRKLVLDEVLATKGSCAILDVGGTAAYWRAFGAGLDWNRISVVLLNLSSERPERPQMRSLIADARATPFPDMSFDVVHSNSMIEHVGLWPDMRSVAQEIRRLAPRYFVQTPYYWFPIEPHAQTPFLHWLPEPLQARILMARRSGYYGKADNIATATERIQSAFLLDRTQLRWLFPDAKILTERAFGLPKSIVALKCRSLSGKKPAASRRHQAAVEMPNAGG
ncbi:MAG: class I SAM-dependent methyltransferase [Variibacter sp.]